MPLLSDDDIDARLGQLEGWQRWEPAIQSLCSGRAVYSPAVWTDLVDRHGEPLDLHQNFAVDDDEDAMRHFLHVTGYLHLKDVFTADEVAKVVLFVASAECSYLNGSIIRVDGAASIGVRQEGNVVDDDPRYDWITRANGRSSSP
jgi:hypothetical protein